MSNAQETIRLSDRLTDVDDLPVKVTITVTIPAGWSDEHKRAVRNALATHMAKYEDIVDDVSQQRQPTLLPRNPS